jgi:hypothetical protein
MKIRRAIVATTLATGALVGGGIGMDHALAASKATPSPSTSSGSSGSSTTHLCPNRSSGSSRSTTAFRF